MAGIWGLAESEDGQMGSTFAIITSDPNTKMSEIHNRQAIILEPREYAEWLAENERPPVHLLRILPDDDLTIAEVEPTTTKPDEPPAQSGFLFG
jgi:putative SOS response-associated peptidase YedK